MDTVNNGYLCFYKGKQIEVYAATAYAARQQAAALLKAKHPYDLVVVLAEKAGQPVLVSTNTLGN